MADHSLIARILAELDPATLRIDLIKSVHFINVKGAPVLITHRDDIADFLNHHPRYVGAEDCMVMIDQARAQREIEEEVAFIKERVCWLLTYGE